MTNAPIACSYDSHMKFLKIVASVLIATTILVLGLAVQKTHADSAVLGVTQITATKTFATADGTFENGWQWVFNVTVPSNQTVLRMKFADWVNGSNIIPAASNIRFYSDESSNASASTSAIAISGANTYSDIMNVNPNVDLDALQGGRQIQIVVETRVPVGSAGGSYSTSYGINSQATSTITLSNLVQTYDATPKSVMVTTDPIGLSTSVTYNASTTAPINAGSYNVVAMVTDPNYFGMATGTLVINRALTALMVTGLSASDKVYDGTTTTSINGTPELSGVTIGDEVTVTCPSTGNFADKNIGTDKSVTVTCILSGANASNYSLTQPTLAANITRLGLTATVTAHSKIYDGNRDAIAECHLDGILEGDHFECSAAAATFDTKNASTSKIVTVTGMMMLGADSANYRLDNTTATTSADITVRPITVIATTNTKSYDGTTNALALPMSLPMSLATGDTASFTETYDTADVGTGKTLTATGTVSDMNDGHNYKVTYVNNLTGVITAADQTIAIDPSSIPNGSIDGNMFTLVATSTSGLAVTFTGSTDTVCTVASNGTVTINSTGTCKVTAKQVGDANHNAAPDVTLILTVTFNVKVGPQSLEVDSLPANSAPAYSIHVE